MSKRTGTKAALAVLAGVVTAVVTSFAAATPVYAHGYTIGPVSRQSYCADGTVRGCGPIQYEPQSVEGPKGFPNGGPADGRICSGGLGRFAQLDDPRGGAWPAETVQAGQSYRFSWEIGARHATAKFEYFITNDGYDPQDPLTRADLELTPFLTIDYGGALPPHHYTHGGTLPTGKSGRHLILAVWTIADTGNAFYACSDVVFGSEPGDPGDPGDEPGDCAAPAWESEGIYYYGDVVSHDGAEWRAGWWTQGEEPGTTGEWGVWQSLGAC